MARFRCLIAVSWTCSQIVLVLVYADQTLTKYAKQKIWFHRFGKAVGRHGMRGYPFKLVAPTHSLPCASAIDPKSCMDRGKLNA